MSNPFFLKSITAAHPGSLCDDPLHDCDRGPRQLNTKMPDHYWNPKRRARIKRICPVCYDVRQFKYARHMEQRRADLAAMDAHNDQPKESC